jgi:hypothetical protein
MMAKEVDLYDLESALTKECGDDDLMFGKLRCMFRERGCLIDKGCPRNCFSFDYSSLQRGLSRDELDELQDRINYELESIDTDDAT